jgi:hypothetical protein
MAVTDRERPSLRSRVAPFSLPRLLEIAPDQVLQESWNGTAKPCTPVRFRSPPPSKRLVVVVAPMPDRRLEPPLCVDCTPAAVDESTHCEPAAVLCRLIPLKRPGFSGGSVLPAAGAAGR